MPTLLKYSMYNVQCTLYTYDIEFFFLVFFFLLFLNRTFRRHFEK